MHHNSVNVSGPSANNRTGFIGVYRKRKRYAAQITIMGKTFALGVYSSPEEAAIVRDMAVFSVHGRMATLNFPELANKAAEDRKDAEWPETLRRLREAG